VRNQTIGRETRREQPVLAANYLEKKWRADFSSSVASVMDGSLSRAVTTSQTSAKVNFFPLECKFGEQETLSANLARLKDGFRHLLKERVRLELKLSSKADRSFK